MRKNLTLYLHVHQPFRVREYSIFDVAKNHDYFGDDNREILLKVAEKSYLPTNKILLNLLKKYPEFKLSLSITGTVIEQFEMWSPETLESFKRLVDTGRVEIVGETYYHSLAFFYSRAEFVRQVAAHEQKIFDVFGVRPTAFRNTELAYNNDLAKWADEAGYQAVLCEGWDKILHGRSPNHVYRPINTENIKLLMKNYKLSDDLAFRFSNPEWSEYPLTIDKYIAWLDSEDAPLVNLFIDYETFGEHQWEDSGIFDFLKKLPAAWLEKGHAFATITEAAKIAKPVAFVDTKKTITWADAERDLSAWIGNKIQQDAQNKLYDLEEKIMTSKNLDLISDWRKLTASDNPYYMCTKYFTDGDVHAYFSPYDSPYDAFLYFQNTLRDVQTRS